MLFVRLLLLNQLVPFISDILNSCQMLRMFFCRRVISLQDRKRINRKYGTACGNFSSSSEKLSANSLLRGPLYRVHRRVHDQSIHWFRCYFKNFTIYYSGGRFSLPGHNQICYDRMSVDIIINCANHWFNFVLRCITQWLLENSRLYRHSNIAGDPDFSRFIRTNFINNNVTESIE